jgi:hypothetical protein
MGFPENWQLHMDKAEFLTYFGFDKETFDAIDQKTEVNYKKVESDGKETTKTESFGRLTELLIKTVTVKDGSIADQCNFIVSLDSKDFHVDNTELDLSMRINKVLNCLKGPVSECPEYDIPDVMIVDGEFDDMREYVYAHRITRIQNQFAPVLVLQIKESIWNGTDYLYEKRKVANLNQKLQTWCKKHNAVVYFDEQSRNGKKVIDLTEQLII